MSVNILTSFNWLDLLMIIVMIATVFRGVVCGFVVELFKIFGVIFVSVFALLFYVLAAERLQHLVCFPVKSIEIL